jgi:hypothetical protein
MPKLFHNPAGSVQPGVTNYLAVCGDGLAFDGATGRQFADFTDGTSNTILLVEADDDHAVVWTKPDDWQYDVQRPLAGLGRAHPDGFNVLFADDSMRVLPRTVDPILFHALLTVAGGESIGDDREIDSYRDVRDQTPPTEKLSPANPEPMMPPAPSITPPFPSRNPEKKPTAIPPEEPPSSKEAVSKGPLTGTWQTSGGAQFRIDDDGTTVAIELISSDFLQTFYGRLARSDKEPDSKALTGTLDAVFKPDAPKRYAIRVTVTIDDSDHLRLRCSAWPVWNNVGRVIGKRSLDESWRRL